MRRWLNYLSSELCVNHTLLIGLIVGTEDASSSETSASEDKSAERVNRLESDSAVLSANLSDLELKLQLIENTLRHWGVRAVKDLQLVL